MDWEGFRRLAQFHRIEGLSWEYLSRDQSAVPPSIARTLKEAATAAAIQNLQAISESHRLLVAFSHARIPLLFLKGLTLAAIAYRNPALKSAIDIDLLIDPEDLRGSAILLRNLGYHLVIPTDSTSEDALRLWHRRRKESVWVNETGLQIDLHTRAADNAALIPAITVQARSQTVEVGGVELPTLAPEELFAYLAVHGASSAWFRLKWIADFAGMLHRGPGADIERLYRRSQELAAGRAAGQALLLADALFGSMVENDSLRTELSADRATRWLLRAAWRQLTGPPEEPTENRLGTVAIHATQFLLKPGIGYKASELAGQIGRLR